VKEATPVTVNILDANSDRLHAGGTFGSARYSDGKMRGAAPPACKSHAVLAAPGARASQAKNNLNESNVVAQQLQALRAKLDAALAPRLK
jgi:hypothetical protein